ncbi:MAG: bifunctional DNA primase/polymerase, partial [Actinomycetota bacterium]|nr:bifunctional DNA primase/polymerase [Actinomycetota bacterium]
MSSAKAAARYIERGWSPIPVKSRSKQTSLAELAPYLRRPVTREELSSWSWPGVGIVTGPVSEVLVLDVDGPEGEALLKEHGHPITPMVRTGSGGLHLYFRHPDAQVRTGIRVAPGLDVKAAGGYVVAPPSVGPTGQPYEWIIAPEDADPADVPGWLSQLIERPRRNGTAGPVGARIPAGQRNRELTSLAGSMRRRGQGEEEIFAALAVSNRTRCEPPLEEEEVRKIAASVTRYEPADNGLPPSTNGHGVNEPPARFNLTDMGNAERFVARHGQDVRYCYPWSKWLVWTGARWERDDAGRVHRLAKETVRAIYGEAAAAE